MSSAVDAIVRSSVIKGGDNSRVTTAVESGAIDAFDPASIQILGNPKGAAEAARLAGFDKGYNDGLAQARADVTAATEDANKRVRRALAALTQAVDAFDQRQTVALADVEDAILAAALEIARNIVQRELVVAEDPGGDALARTLALVPDRGDIIAHLHPDDVATLNMERLSSTTRAVRLLADPTIELGGCIIEVGDMRIDGQLSTAFEHVRQALGLESANASMNEIPTAEPLINEVVEVARANAASAAQESPSVADEVTSPDTVAGRDRKPSRKTAQEAPGN